MATISFKFANYFEASRRQEKRAGSPREQEKRDQDDHGEDHDNMGLMNRFFLTISAQLPPII